MDAVSGLDLYHALAAAHRHLGAPVDLIENDAVRDHILGMEGAEFYRTGPQSVIGFHDGVFYGAIHPEDRNARTLREVIRRLGAYLTEHSVVRCAVWYLNWPSIIIVRKLGAQLLGVDENKFFHYELTRGGFGYGHHDGGLQLRRHGQESLAAEVAEPAAAD